MRQPRGGVIRVARSAAGIILRRRRATFDAVNATNGRVTDAISDGVDIVTDFIDENPKTSIAIGVLAGIATAGVAAPAIAASIGATGALGATASGTVIAGLEGAALSSASLAALGGGSIAAGGAGMAGGTCVVAAGGGLLAGGVSAGGVATTKALKN